MINIKCELCNKQISEEENTKRHNCMPSNVCIKCMTENEQVLKGIVEHVKFCMQRGVCSLLELQQGEEGILSELIEGIRSKI
ncbi:hypothetical protein GOV12_07020 [Candidatus Pacearchaeota archaeon]|nr:hypothetical protein [Candidatus Pacearchaeota archaeon]